MLYIIYRVVYSHHATTGGRVMYGIYHSTLVGLLAHVKLSALLCLLTVPLVQHLLFTVLFIGSEFRPYLVILV